ncbi:peptidoglycan-binding domain-containing protein [Amycolatopsis anabasis]|uniref:peptidoglycan-binding domain-containing protein n=1 Tax=Amycolatopsis anabasis TaxID=1840409 RepID=UPI00131B7CD7|nr:peptidoglycan-binding domain-containing protein [Amycolatopsis anabasis]
MTTSRGPGLVRRRRGRRLLAAAVVLAVLGTAGVLVVARLAATGEVAAEQAAAPPVTTPVRRLDLVDRIQVTGELGHGPASPISGHKPGTVTWLPGPGAVIGRGEPLYAVDAVGVRVLFGATPMYRELGPGVPPGPDVHLVQENLIALGYREIGRADGIFGDATARALKRWQRAIGVEPTGKLALGDVVVAPGPVRVDRVTARLGAPAEGELVTAGGIERLVTAELEESQQAYAKPGARAEIGLPDGRATTGTVQSVAPKAAEGKSGDGGKLVASLALADPAAAPETGRVTVAFDGERRAGVLAVPVQALLALAGGGYALEVADTRRLIAVEPGLFAAGLVEVSGQGLAEGLRVVTAA